MAKLKSKPALPDVAYDIHIRPRAPKPDPGDGWVFGLPRGITPPQWPLDPHSGYPMMHGFTLVLPQAYRCHGPEIVALSFFATAPEHNDGGPVNHEDAAAAFAAHARKGGDSIPGLHRMEDILGCAYAVLLLTDAQVRGASCNPPAPLVSSVLRPRWLDEGAAFLLYGDEERTRAGLQMSGMNDSFLHRAFGERPVEDMAWSRALELTPRVTDPNAGKAPVEPEDETPGGYQSVMAFETDASGKTVAIERSWARDLGANHLGGSMRPVQGIPAGFSPFYIGFEEYFGGYNFGGGAAQLDFLNMKFDWAC